MLRPNTIGCPNKEHGVYPPSRFYLPRPRAMERARQCYFERIHESPEARAAACRRQEQQKSANVLRWLLSLALDEMIVCEGQYSFSAAAAPVSAPKFSLEQRFRALADEWTRETMHISSASDIINDRRYQEIINLGWDVVPYLLHDLQQNKRFWFPALAAITGVRPFDPSDASNPRRMTEAWVKWGKRKGLLKPVTPTSFGKTVR